METPQTEALTLHQCEAGGSGCSWLMLNQCGTKLGFLAREVEGKDRAESHGVEGKPCFQVIVFLEGLWENNKCDLETRPTFYPTGLCPVLPFHLSFQEAQFGSKLIEHQP